MKRMTRTLGALVFSATLVSALAVPAYAVDTNTPSLEELERALFAPDAAAVPDLEAAEAGTTEPDPSLGQPESQPLSGGSFYICLSSDLLCGGPCPSGTHCATEACGSPFNTCCTFQTACVGGCQVSPGCSAICRSCNDF